MRNAARLTIDLGALVNNYQNLASRCAPAECAAAIKANAYGLGMPEVLHSLLKAGCKTFFVATVAEGCDVRLSASQSGFNPVIYVLEGPCRESIDYLVEHDLRPVLNSIEQIEIWRAHSQLAAAIHVDTGMHRLGMRADEFRASKIETLNIHLLMSHLACGDEPENPENLKQLAVMKEVFAAQPLIPKSFAHSAGILLGAAYHADLCRPGIGLYGANPLASGENPMQAVVRLEGRVIQIHWAEAGEAVGYGGSYVSSEKSLLATLALGYADGLPKSLSGRGVATFLGKPCPIVGKISMDLTIVDVSSVASEIHAGCWMEFLGQHTSVDEMAKSSDRFSYELLCSLGLRAQRIYTS